MSPRNTITIAVAALAVHGAAIAGRPLSPAADSSVDRRQYTDCILDTVEISALLRGFTMPSVCNR